MLTLYWLALILGGGLALFSLIGDFTGTDVEHAGALDHGMDHGAHGGADHDALGWHLFTLRTATYFLFGFGAAGVLVGVTSGDSRPLAAALAAVFTGAVSGLTSASVFRYLRRTGSGEMQGDS